MKFFPLILNHMRRTLIRTTSTILALAICIALFCTLQAVLSKVNAMIEGRGPRRLVIQNAVSFIFPLPLSYAEEIARVPGVTRVAGATIFGGLLKVKREGRPVSGAETTTDWSNYFPNIAVDAEPYFAMNPELMVPQDQFRNFLNDRMGCVIGRKLVEKYGWRVGDHFFLESLAPPYRKKSGPFEFVIRGLIDTDPAKYPGTDTNMMFFHFKYFNESLGGSLGPGMYLTEISDPDRAAEIGREIDNHFDNSSAQTYTQTEKAFMEGAMTLAGNLALLLNGIGLAVSFTILLVTANTMSMAIRERRAEIAVLKTLGFTSLRVMGLFVSESLVLGGAAGILGIGATEGFIWGVNHLPGTTYLPLSGLRLSPTIALFGIGAALLVGFLAGFLPAWRAYRASILDLLRAV